MPLLIAAAVTFFSVTLMTTAPSGFSPKRFKKLSSAGKENKKFYSLQKIITTLVGSGFGVQEYRKELSDNKEVPGYAYSLYRHTRDGRDDVDDIASERKLDVRSSNFAFKRQSHENDASVKGNRGFNQFVVVVNPSLEYYDETVILEYGKEICQFTVNSVERMTNDTQHFCATIKNKKLSSLFKRFEPSDNLTDFNNLKSLDELITDNSIYWVLRHYILPDDIEDSKVYEYLHERGMEFFYSRNKRSGSFNQYPIQKLGYPDNVDMINKFW